MLEALAEETAEEVAERRSQVSLLEIQRLAQAGPAVRDFTSALRLQHLAVIAEVKASSPSGGRIVAGPYEPGRLAAAYQAGGAAAISVLCQKTSFGGDPEHLRAVRRSCSLPILRKDFVIDAYQVYEARALGADAVLLIVALLSFEQLQSLVYLASALGIAALVEAHTEAEVALALQAGALAIGVNNRDLRTLRVDTSVAAGLRRLVPPDVVYVAESGISSSSVAAELRAAGADAILVGEALLRSPDPGALIAELSVI